MQEPSTKPEISEDFICSVTSQDKGKEKMADVPEPKPLLALASWIFPLTEIISDFSKPLSETEAQALSLTQVQKEHLKDWLWSFVEQSKTDETIAPQASKAITTLNAMGVGFIGKYGNLR